MRSNEETDSYYFSDNINEKLDCEYDPVRYNDIKVKKRNNYIKYCKIALVGLSAVALLVTFTDISSFLFITFCYLTNNNNNSLKSSVEDKDFIVNQFLSILSSSNEAEQRSRELTLNPHLAGHDFFDKNTSAITYITDKFNEYGLTTYNETFNVSLNTPIKTGLKLYQKSFSNSSNYDSSSSSSSKLIYDAPLVEDELDVDPFPESSIYKGGWHGLSKNGTVKSDKYVFTNYGTLQDYKLLAENNVSTEGAICISKYGNIFRGLKVKFAQEVGKCAAVVLYSDPGDDFYKASDGYKSYPDGPARNPSSIQRGSVMFLSDLQKDVSDFTDIIPEIPSIPVSFAAIQPILKTLNGHGLSCSVLDSNSNSSSWCNGGVEGVEYSTGPVPESKGLELEVENIQDYNERQIVDIMGNLTIGAKSPKTERGYIVIGAHRDTWSSGGADPESGSTVLLEILRALKELKDKFDWAPKTNIVFASWDAEEYGLIGSNLYVSKHAKDLKSNALAYLNVDVACSGSKLEVGASPLLNNIITKVFAQIEYPKDPSQTLYDHYFGHEERISSLGSGSDYTAFLEHAGIPSLDIGFTSGEGDPAYHYHSNYDSFYWMSQLQDPGYKYHNAISKALGAILLELSENELIQFQTHDYLSLIDSFFVDIADKVPESWYSFKPKHHPKFGKKGGKGCPMKAKHHGKDVDGKKFEDKEMKDKDFEGKKFDGKKPKHHDKDFKGKKFEEKEIKDKDFKGKKFDGEKPKKNDKFLDSKKFEEKEIKDKDFEGKKSKRDEKDFETEEFGHQEKNVDTKKSEDKKFKHQEKETDTKKSEDKKFKHQEKETDAKKSEDKKSKHAEKETDAKKSEDKKSKHTEKETDSKKSDKKKSGCGNSKNKDKDVSAKKSDSKKSKHHDKDFDGKKFDHHKPKHHDKDFDAKKSDNEKPPHKKDEKDGSKPPKHGKPGKGEKPPPPPLSLLELMNLTYDNILLSKDKALKTDAKSEELNLDLKNYDWLPFWQRISLNYKILGQNMKLKYFERHFLTRKGLSGRPFFKHAIYAAGHNYGYASTELPGLQDALDIEDVGEFYKWLKTLNHIFEE